ncbi:DUF5719 family protein [Demequina activiva]|uniref:Secreted protein n=1 Tax=Demequina activiva TaxID=1582364 RepID=A0A919Q347_9MICO|nr:DUF5719 family protein [Demequina activiva]GIG55387.1 hypothetical protein Dac01nite_21390 [Demequina activiva]
MIRMVATAVALACVLGAATLAAPEPGGEGGATAVVPIAPVRQPLACPGPLEIPVGAISSGDEVLDSGSADVTYDVTPTGRPVGAGVAVDAPQAVSVERVGTGDIAGLAGVGCTPPAQDQWLVGGSTALGASARLVLTNPTASAVRARVQIYGPGGLAEQDASVLLGPDSQGTLLLESIAPEVTATAVHIRAEGVGVSAALQDSRLDGFTAAGTDWVSPVEPATSLAIPVAGASTDDAPASVSLMAPDGAEVTLALVTEDGPQPWLGDEAVVLEPGVVTEIQVPVAALAAIQIEATAPVVAGARVLVARDAPLDDGSLAFDHAWTGGQDVSETRSRALVVPDADVTLVATSPAGGTFTAEIDGETVSVDLGAGVLASLPGSWEPGTVITSSHAAAWALLVTDADAGFITTVEPVVTELDGRDVTVTVGSYPLVP